MLNNSVTCPRCNTKKFREDDVACLNCGTLFNKTPLKSKTVTSEALLKRNFKNLYASIFLIVTLCFSYMYIFDFSYFFNIGRLLLKQTDIETTLSYYSVLKKISLSKNHDKLNFKIFQLCVENTKTKNISESFLKITNQTNTLSDNGILILKFNLKNISQTNIRISNDLFYLKSLNKIYEPISGSENNIVLEPSKEQEFELIFKPSLFDSNCFKDFSGELVFNNCENYVNLKLNLITNRQ